MTPATRALMISAGWRSSGKTTVAAGLAAALAQRGLRVQPFKRGPDFIDPQWLGAAARRACRSLDLRLQGVAGVEAYWRQHCAGADVALIEGSHGLHDGLAADGSDSNAALARRLGVPVVLVIDARGMSRGIAALAMGLAAFDPQVAIAGVILNRVGGARHEAKLRAAIETHTALRVLGAVPDDARLGMVERHLGLVPANEASDPEAAIAQLAETMAARVDLDALLAAAAIVAITAPAPGSDCRPLAGAIDPTPSPRIGIARDRAFGFYYPDDLEALHEAGATLVEFDTIADARLPKVDGIFLGGGFPEMLARELEANRPLRAELRGAIEAGLPVYAECGGLMFLARTLTHRGRTWQMAGAIPADVVMHAKPVGKGYVTLAPTADDPWKRGNGTVIEAHEFHYSSLANVDPTLRFAYRVLRGHGIDGARDGIVHRNVLASYAHLRSVGGNDWAARFVAHVRRVRDACVRVAA